MKARYIPRIDLHDRMELKNALPLETPYVIHIDPCDTCNFSCKFCPSGNRELMKKTKGRGHGPMDYDVFCRIIDSLQEFKEPIEMGLKEEELQPLVDMWRQSNPNIVRFWWDVDRAVKKAVKEKEVAVVKGIRFFCKSGMLFIQLPSGRQLAYVKPRMGENRFGGESVTYEGVGATKKWERLESYGPKFVENIVQASSRDILWYTMRTLSDRLICAHVHDELIIECREEASLDEICELMGRAPAWADGLMLRADGYETKFYKKD